MSDLFQKKPLLFFILALSVFASGCFSKSAVIDRRNHRFHSEEIGLTVSFSPQWQLSEEKETLFVAEFRPSGAPLARLTATEETNIPRLEDFIRLGSFRSLAEQNRKISRRGDISHIQAISSEKKEIKGNPAWEVIWSAERNGIPTIFHTYTFPADLRMLQFHFEFPEASYVGHQQVISVVLETTSFGKGRPHTKAEHALAHQIMGDAYRGRELWKEAIEAYERALSYRPKDSELYILLGESYLKDEQADKALQAYLDATRLAPQDAKAYAGLAEAHFKKGEIDPGVSAYKRAIGLSPENADFYIKLGATYMTAGRAQEAVTLYQKLLRRHPTSAEGHLGLGKAYLEMSLYEEAILEFEKVLSRSPQVVEAHCLLEKAYTELGSTTDAEKQNALCKPSGPPKPSGT